MLPWTLRTAVRSFSSWKDVSDCPSWLNTAQSESPGLWVSGFIVYMSPPDRCLVAWISYQGGLWEDCSFWSDGFLYFSLCSFMNYSVLFYSVRVNVCVQVYTGVHCVCAHVKAKGQQAQLSFLRLCPLCSEMVSCWLRTCQVG